MPADSSLNPSDDHVLALFDGAGPVDTPTPGTRAWIANDASNGRKPVLIKRLAGNGERRGRATESLVLLHPNILRTRRWLSEGANLYVVRDVVRGKNLRQSLAAPGGTRPSPELVRRIIVPVIDALEYAHAQGLAHGGVSPENVLITEEGQILVSDFATTDPKAPHHVGTYSGVATVGGDVKAASRVVAAYLPTTGAFASPAVRGRIEGLLQKCDTLGDLKETVAALEKLAGPSAGGASKAAPAATSSPQMPPLDTSRTRSAPWKAEPAPPATPTGEPLLVCQVYERNIRLQPGGGGEATLIVRNEGTAPLVVRMIATQHAWLNVRPIDLPLTIPPGSSERVLFAISAARLSPGDYRSEVYLSTPAPTNGAQLRGGNNGIKHTCEIRISVEGNEGKPGPTPTAPKPAPPTIPPQNAPAANAAPRLPATPGCGVVLPLLPLFFVFGVFRLLHQAIRNALLL